MAVGGSPTLTVKVTGERSATDASISIVPCEPAERGVNEKLALPFEAVLGREGENLPEPFNNTEADDLIGHTSVIAIQDFYD